MNRREIRRGDIYTAILELGIGSEQTGIRPVLIIQNNVGNIYSNTTIIAPISSSYTKHDIPTHVFLNNKEYLYNSSIILLEQIRVISKNRLGHYIAHLSDKKMKDVDNAILKSLGIKKNKI